MHFLLSIEHNLDLLRQVHSGGGDDDDDNDNNNSIKFIYLRA
jgi:hypothetical protein